MISKRGMIRISQKHLPRKTDGTYQTGVFVLSEVLSDYTQADSDAFSSML